MDAARIMYHTEGFRSFYSGLSPALLGLTHVAVQFPLYEYFKLRFTGLFMGEQPEASRKTHWLGVLSASVLSKICASSATYPHEVIRTRLQTQQRSFTASGFYDGISVRGVIETQRQPSGTPLSKSPNFNGSPNQMPRYRGLIKTFTTILAEEGWRAFYSGMGTNMMRAVPAAATTLLTYEFTMSSIRELQSEGARKLACANF
ncbi:MAG: hypothetical protein M1829_002715 [Trizodia sp. TS-e1964]|nr:MAG: hypothetical protein M1829_002715 [Trizodia sp. TS-e1964]